ncbi:MAG: hypothetical protein VX335_01185 [Pseudomonadota bacterium]|nr:hypothetical protein [Pseudomonadota bacterium]
MNNISTYASQLGRRLENEPYSSTGCHQAKDSPIFYSLVASYPVMVLFSAMIGAAILAHYYDNYNVVEATIMPLIGLPTCAFFGFFAPMAANDGSDTSIDLWICICVPLNSIVSSLVGREIYNQFGVSEMGRTQTLAAAAVGSSICSGVSLITYRATTLYLYCKGNNENEIDNTRQTEQNPETEEVNAHRNNSLALTQI